MIFVNRVPQPSALQTPLLVAALLLALALDAPIHAQSSNPTSATNPYYGSITLHASTDETLKLSLDDAIALGFKNNLGLKEAEYGEKQLHGEKNEALQQFLPTLILSGSTGVHEQNLTALGFGPGVVGEFSSLFPGGVIPHFSEITKDTLTQGQIQFSQTLFSGPVIAGYKAAGAAERAAHFAMTRARGEVVQQVATAYLHAVAASSEVDNARALEAEDQVLFNHAHESHLAGTAANLDELRARVQLQSQQQARINAETSSRKTSSCSSAKSASRPARKSSSPIPLLIAISPSKLLKKSAPSPTRIARTTRNSRTRPSS